jgi:hypothetical protein
MLAASDEPHDLHDALSSAKSKQAMVVEFDALQKNGTWHLVSPKSGSNIINCKWVYKVNRRTYGSINGTRLVWWKKDLSSGMELIMRARLVLL